MPKECLCPGMAFRPAADISKIHLKTFECRGGFIYIRKLMRHDQKTLKAVSEQFDISGTFVDAVPYGSGHINDTYKTQWRVDGRTELYILQRINNQIFKTPHNLMDNILRVTGHLQQKLAARKGCDPSRATLSVIPTRDGRPMYEDAAGNFWRTYVFIVDAQTYDVCASPEQAYQVANAFGRFQAALADLPGGRLHETIPYFHHTPRRFEALEAAIQKDVRNRAASVRGDIEFCLAHKPLGNVIVRLLENQTIPERITHNDSKINNVMIDDRTGRGVCVIDLDTVMSGCALYDFGDMVRTVARRSDEDERDTSKVLLDIGFFECLVRGYLEGVRSFLTRAETDLMVVSGMLITLTIGIRFLTDYLMGDVYFKFHRPDHNLDRARVQFKMLANMEQQEDAMQAIVRKYALNK